MLVLKKIVCVCQIKPEIKKTFLFSIYTIYVLQYLEKKKKQKIYEDCT